MPDASHAAFTALDWAVLIAFLVGTTLFGLWMARRVKSSGDYFTAGRRLPWWIMVGQAFGTGTHAEQPVAQAGATCRLGFATIWYQWKNMLITPFYWLICPWYWRSQRTTVGEIVEDRYGRGVGLGYTLFAIAFFVCTQGVMLKGAAKIVSVATGGHMISPNGVVVAMTAAFILYSFFGGLLASAYTDFIQSFLIIVLSFMLIPAGLHAVGGFRGMRAALPASAFELYGRASGLDAFTIAMLAINGLVGITAQPHMVSMAGTGRSERAGRVGMTYGSLIKRFCTIGWALTGLIVAAMLVQRHQTLADPEDTFGYASLQLLGSGMTGLLVACVLAANMSSCSNFMVNTGALFTRNLYREYARPDAPDPELLLVGRLSGLGLTLLGILFALLVDQVLDAFLFTESISAFVGVTVLGGILWRRANRWGAWGATICAFGVYYAVNLLEAGRFKLVYAWRPGPFGWAMLGGFAALAVVSLATQPEEKGRIESFFAKLQSPPTERDELLFVDLTGWRSPERRRAFFRRYREDLVGLALAAGVVVLLVVAAWLLMQIGR